MGDELEGGQAGAPPSSPPPGNSPETDALRSTIASQARELGSTRAARDAALREAAEIRAAAEAERQANEAQQMAAILGDDGVAAWTQMAELSQSDPLEAARYLAGLMGRGQTAPPAPGAASGQPGAGSPAQPPEAPVNGQQPATPATPPPPLGGVDASAPLAAPTTGEDRETIAAALEAQFNDIRKRNLDPTTRNRVTMRDRASAMIAYIGAAVLRSDVQPKAGRR
ncbi:MAG TPA: hypothetical protein VIV06_04710 [Candidatus Limnocylindrales bacterium]